jgi:hypothetical protein
MEGVSVAAEAMKLQANSVTIIPQANYTNRGTAAASKAEPQLFLSSSPSVEKWRLLGCYAVWLLRNVGSYKSHMA